MLKAIFYEFFYVVIWGQKSIWKSQIQELYSSLYRTSSDYYDSCRDVVAKGKEEIGKKSIWCYEEGEEK